MKSISGYKDTDREILLNLSYKDLLAASCINKYFYNHVCDDNFFHKKLLKTYEDTLKYFNKDCLDFRTYKQYYFQIVSYILKLKEEFNYSYNIGDPITQYYIFKNINYEESKNQELLWKSCRNGELELVKEAVKRGSDIDEHNETALLWASYNGHLEVIKYLVSLGADIHAQTEYSLKWSSSNGHLETVKYLVSLGADIKSH